MEKEEEENEGGGAETTMETEVHAAVAAEMGKVHATMEKMGNVMAGQIKDGMDHMLKELRSSLSAEMGRELDKRDQQMEQRFGRRGGASEAEFGETQQNLGHVLQTPGTSVDNGAQEEKLNHSGESAAKAWVRGGSEQVEAPTGNAGGEPAEELYESHLKTMNNVSLGMVDRSDIFYKTIQAELSTATGDLTSIVDIVARSMRSLLGLNHAPESGFVGS